MIPIAFVFFLMGAVLAWRFRVWILVSSTVFMVLGLTIFELSMGTHLLPAIGFGCLLGLTLQVGYFCGLLSRNILIVFWTPRKTSAFIAGDHPISLSQPEYFQKRVIKLMDKGTATKRFESSRL